GGGKTSERIVIAHRTDKHADDNESKERHQSEAQHHPEFLVRYRAHQVRVAFRQDALHGALTRSFAEPATAHETFGGDIDVEGIARGRIEKALNAARHVRHG